MKKTTYTEPVVELIDLVMEDIIMTSEPGDNNIDDPFN